VCFQLILVELFLKPFFLQAQVFTGQLPKADNSIHHGDKLHQVFVNTRTTLENILAGYCLPEPYFKDRLQSTVDTLMKCLRDPALPLYELQVRLFDSFDQTLLTGWLASQLLM
jgi:hypothetical protein